jgi:hypothetical protein
MADNITLNAGSGGDTTAADDIGGVKYQRVKVTYGVDGAATDASESNPLPVKNVQPVGVYRLVIPPQAVGASKVYADLFNATGSGVSLRVLSVWAFPAIDVAVTGVLGVRLHLTRTSAVGTGGTTVATDDTNLANATIAKMDPALAALPSQVTARLAPSGGATAGAHVAFRHVFTEETSAGAAVNAAQGAEFVRSEGSDMLVPANSGLRLVQGSVASVGSVGFEVNFALQ